MEDLAQDRHLHHDHRELHHHDLGAHAEAEEGIVQEPIVLPQKLVLDVREREEIEAIVHGKRGECRRALLLEVSEACEAVFVQPKHLEKLYGRLGDLHEKVDEELKAVKRRTAAVEQRAGDDALDFVKLEVEVERLDSKVREIEAHVMHCSRDESLQKEQVVVDAAEEAKKYLARFRSSLRPGMPVHIDGIGGLAAGWVNGAAGVVGQYDAGQNQWLVTLGEKDVWIRESFLQP